MLQINIKPNLFDRNRKLIISQDLITYEDSDWKNISDTTFKKGEIVGFRFGIEPIKGYIFTIGWLYRVDIKGNDNRIMKIRFTSLYNIRNKQLQEKYSAIIDAFFDNHQDNIINKYIEIFNTHSKVEILETTIKWDSVQFNGNNIFYHDLGVKEYARYFTLFSKSNPKIYKAYNYRNDWNAAVVYSICKRLMAENGF